MLNKRTDTKRLSMFSASSTLALALALAGSPAFAQGGPAYSNMAPLDDGEIIVTARKRDETAIAIPVVLTAVGQADIERRAITRVDDLGALVPTLVSGEGGGVVQGGIVSLRGLASTNSALGDQAVSFVIDGVQVGRASVRRMGDFDMTQMEVLKGPQALFYGKNSPAGIISIHTADPTPSLQAKLIAGYEAIGDEIRTEGFVSAPVTDTLGIRLAGFYSHLNGWVKNTVPDTSSLQREHDHAPRSREFGLRGTLKWDPADNFSARLKLSYNRARGSDAASNVQLVNCVLPLPQTGGGAVDDCKADDHVSVGELGPNFGRVEPRFGDGDTYLKQDQMLGGLELNYNPMEDITITSMTGFYKFKLDNLSNYTASYNPATLLGSLNELRIREISQELRVSSSWDGPFNFLMGGFFQDTHGNNASVTYFNANSPTFINNYRYTQDGRSFSIFGQAQIKIVPQFELSVGGRQTWEKKELPLVLSATAAGQPLAPVSVLQDRGKWENFSPEVSLTYRPTDRLTLFASFKRGFLSGGFNSGATNFSRSLVYNQQTTEGFEGGIKAALLDGALRTNLALYNYKTKGLQVTVTTNAVQQDLRNAGSVRTKGAEFDFTYRTPLDGLSLHGALAYSRGRYLEYLAPCHQGQTQPDCRMMFNPIFGTTGLQQDLSGTQLARAPEWAGNAGFTYETPVSSRLKLGLSGDMNFSSAYFTNGTSSPGGRQQAYQVYDAAIRLMDEDAGWEVAVIGKNLSDEYYFVNGPDNPFTGTSPGSAPGTGRLADTVASVSRGRQVMLRLTMNFGGGR